MLERIRIARLTRCYRRLAKAEAKVVTSPVAIAMRGHFTQETLNMIDVGVLQRTMTRTQRRQLKRKITSGIGGRPVPFSV